MRPIALVFALTASLGLSVLAAGCGGSGSKAAATTTTSSTTSTTGRFGGRLTAAQSAQFQKYRACLRQHGVDFGGFGGNGQPPGGNGQPPAPGTTTRRRPTLTPAQQAAQTKALNACRSLAPSGFQFGRPAGAQNGQQGGQFAAYRSCMRQHGVNLAASGSGQQQPSFNSKKFRAATQACGHLLAEPGAGTTSGATTTSGG
ncbi:MAG: hypothetical protein ACXVZO_10650 [Gaiellaceae bacterium]